MQASGVAGIVGNAMNRTRRIVIAAVSVLVLVVVGLGVAYLAFSSAYVSTDNAQVDGDKLMINAPATGVVIDWRGWQGTNIHEGELVGRILILGSGAQPQQVIRSPGEGTIAENPLVNGAYVTTGMNLATAYDLGTTYATARVDENDVGSVHAGQAVDITADAFPDTAITGVVVAVGSSSSGEFSLFPESNSNGNFQKVSQVIPVKIAFTGTAGARLTPGMNITARIRKDPAP